MTKTFTTSTGIRRRTASTRRYIVVDLRNDARIVYRTDVLDRARTRAAKATYFETIDTTTGAPA